MSVAIEAQQSVSLESGKAICIHTGVQEIVVSCDEEGFLSIDPVSAFRYLGGQDANGDHSELHGPAWVCEGR